MLLLIVAPASDWSKVQLTNFIICFWCCVGLALSFVHICTRY